MKQKVLSTITMLLFTLLIVSSASAELTSTFDLGTEGWGVWSSDPDDVHSFQWNSSGGNPGGYVSAVDGATGAVWWFVSPGSWAGDWTEYIGGTIEWDILLCDAAEIDIFESVEIWIDAPDVGNWIEAHVDVTPILHEWVHFSIDLTPENFNVVGSRDFDSIMSDVASIGLRGEFITGYDTEGLDNVRVASVPEPTSVLLIGTGLIGLAGLRRKFKK